MSVENILAEWSYLKPAQVFSVLAYYRDHRQEIDEVREQSSYEEWKRQHTDAASMLPLVSPRSPHLASKS